MPSYLPSTRLRLLRDSEVLSYFHGPRAIAQARLAAKHLGNVKIELCIGTGPAWPKGRWSPIDLTENG